MKKTIQAIYKRYVIDAMSAMALGLFSSLIIGTILDQMGKIPYLGILREFAAVAMSPYVVGTAIGLAVASGLNAAKLALFSAAVCGAVGNKLAGPLGAFFAAVAGAEIGMWIYGKTRLDILAVPGTAIIAGGLVATVLSGPINAAIAALQEFVEVATLLQPIPMGIVLSVVFGMVLTAPISSAALAAVVFTVPGEQVLSPGLQLAAGAATVGCCAQMVGFAVASYRENGVSGLVSQGIGTSMLQFGNIMAKPIIWLPPTIASAITGPMATTWFQMTNMPGAYAGMGTSGLVGQVGTFLAMTDQSLLSVVLRVLLLHFILPAAITLAISEGMRKLGWIKYGDMALAGARQATPKPDNVEEDTNEQ